MEKTYTIKSVGAGLLMHSDRGLDKTHPAVVKMKEITSGGSKNRTEAEDIELQRLEFVLGIYHDENVGPYLPAHVIEACLRDAAKGRKLGKEFTRSVMVLDDMVPLGYSGPRDLQGLWDKRFYDARSVKVGQSRIVRTRPHFATWAATFSVSYDEEFVDGATLDWALETAGRRIGLGDFRPRFGRFEVAA